MNFSDPKMNCLYRFLSCFVISAKSNLLSSYLLTIQLSGKFELLQRYISDISCDFYRLSKRFSSTFVQLNRC